MGASGGAIGLYTAVVTMLIESYALYAVAFLLYMVPWAIESWVLSIFSSVLGAVQVRGVFAFPEPLFNDCQHLGYRSISHHSTSRQSESANE